MARSAFRAAALLLAAAAVPALADAADAQGLISIEARGGLALPRDAFTNDLQADGGHATELSVTWGVLPFVGVYGAYQRAEFDVEDSEESVISDRGWAGGVRVSIPTPLIPIDPWIRAGVVMHELEAGGLEDGGDRGFGIEAGAGLRLPLRRGLSLTPGVLWTRYGIDDDSVTDGEANVQYLRVDVGLRVGL
jgi:hypothetical protein